MTGAVLHHDFETRSTVDLKKAGVHRYAEHPTTGVWVIRYRFDDGPVHRWRIGEPPPQDYVDHIAKGGRVVAQNAGFERTIQNKVLRRDNPGFPEIRIEQQDCTMARAQVLALPAGLGQMAAALKLPVQKDDVGYRVMMQVCKPRSVAEDGTPVWWDDPAKLDVLDRYCGIDVETECAADKRLPPLTPSEKALWILDQHINDRGVQIDVALVDRAAQAAKAAAGRADREMWRLTDGAVKKCSETAKITAWLNARGVPCESIGKGEFDDIVLKTVILGDETAEKVIRLRRAAAKSSVAKFDAMLRSVCSDGRCRGTLGYHVASTGRWGGRLIQPQNFPRVDAKRDLPDVRRAIALLKTPGRSPEEMVDAIELATGRDCLDVLSKTLRACLVAAPGKKLVGGDFSNIEGRVAAWLAGERWKLEAFRAYDAGHGEDLYKLAYAKSFGVSTAEVDDPKRQIGKVQELSLGYQGSVGAFISMGANYGLKPGPLALAVKAATDEFTWARTRRQYGQPNRPTYGLDVETWTGLKVIVDGWRAAHPNIVQGWWDLQDAAVEAVANPGLIVPVFGGKVQYTVAAGFLFCRLPSGRVLAYASPRLKTTVEKAVSSDGEEYERVKRTVWYEGIDSRAGKSKRWGPQSLYGGLQFENIDQAVSRDLMAESMHRAEAAGFPLVLTVHDELLTEVPAEAEDKNAEALEVIMSVLPQWASGLPVAAKAWEDTRYVK
jgi:DNA polymerase